MRKVLIPFDGSAASRRALQYAVDFAKEYGRLEIHLLNVQEEPVVYGDYLTASLLESLRQAALRAASHALEPAVEVLTQAALPFEQHTTLGPVAERVAEQVERNGCDTIIMGTRGLTGVGSVLMGSVATKVVHTAPVPVLLVR